MGDVVLGIDRTETLNVAGWSPGGGCGGSGQTEPWGTTHSCGAPPAAVRRAKSLS